MYDAIFSINHSWKIILTTSIDIIVKLMIHNHYEKVYNYRKILQGQ